mmetsp:Transcript_21727/g.10164  ORF Transcript_21727/g.10164 Transcript_21727/m.10164 type:complete len:169 (+) Transcript_21727:1599-2105(+)
MTRIAAVKSFFSAFADRTSAYDFKHVIALVVFNKTVKCHCDFTETFSKFNSFVQNVTAGGQTALYDAMQKGITMLNTFTQKYTHCLKRIICLSDGDDNQSNANPVQIAEQIINSNIVIDSFIVGPESEMLKCITLAANGCCFFPTSILTGTKLFEWETMLSASIRDRP